MKSLGLTDAYVYDLARASKAITKVDLALDVVTSVRANIGAQISRLNYSGRALDVMRENMVVSNSRIEDADIAEESSNAARNQVLSQASLAMLMQANQIP